MATTVTDAVGTRPPGSVVPGSRRMNIVKVTFDASYTTGGEAVTAAQCGLAQLDHLEVPAYTDLGTHLARWIPSTGKIRLDTAINTEVAATTNVSTETVTCVAWGI